MCVPWCSQIQDQDGMGLASQQVGSSCQLQKHSCCQRGTKQGTDLHTFQTSARKEGQTQGLSLKSTSIGVSSVVWLQSSHCSPHKHVAQTPRKPLHLKRRVRQGCSTPLVTVLETAMHHAPMCRWPMTLERLHLCGSATTARACSRQGAGQPGRESAQRLRLNLSVASGRQVSVGYIVTA